MAKKIFTPEELRARVLELRWIAGSHAEHLSDEDVERIILQYEFSGMDEKLEKCAERARREGLDYADLVIQEFNLQVDPRAYILEEELEDAPYKSIN